MPPHRLLRTPAFSRDTVLLEVLCVMFYRIVDVRKAIYEVDDLAQVGGKPHPPLTNPHPARPSIPRPSPLPAP